MSSRLIAASAVSLCALFAWGGCNQRVILPVATVGSVSSAASSGGTTQNLATSSNSGSSGGTSGTAGSGGSSTGNASTGSNTGSPPSPYADGGYVGCSLPGSSGEHWMCQPGSYICDVAAAGICFQCQSDRDCANQELPTYDPNRPRCDLDSGVLGYQNFCQQCISNTDCASNPAGSLCDLNPTYPPAAEQPSIETVGFETCGKLQTDCRVDGGPLCRGYNQFCSPDDGQCVTRFGTCTTAQDCVGVSSEYGDNVPAPYCVGGNCAPCPEGGLCPAVRGCQNDGQCGSGGLTCNNLTEHCSCANSGQCGGYWPVCLLFDAGLGSYCGCDSDLQCGDGGLVCLKGPSADSLTGVCGLSCVSPLAPRCGYQACNPLTGTCDACTSDAQCQADPLSIGTVCQTTPGFPGYCGCRTDGDCRAGEVCQPGNQLGTCIVPLPRCTPESCGPSFCDWDSGSCVSPPTLEGPSSCIDDYDCANQLGHDNNAAFCQDGQCVGCRSNVDCVHSGEAASGASMCCLPGDKVCADYSLPSNTCESVCASDQDCVGSFYGPSCTVGDAGLVPHCGCASDSDCTENAGGLRCDRDPSSVFFGSCGCGVDSDCTAGVACGDFFGKSGRCSGSCYYDAGCTVGFTCDPSFKCRPRCDIGHSCAEPDLTCDQGDVVGQNGTDNLGPVPGLTWCYACLHASDCAGGVGCDPEVGCGYCRQSSDCPSGKACIDGGICQPTCVDGGCSAGETCDNYGAAGYGANVCLGCVSAADCPNGEGCDSQSHTCGTCEGPTATGGPFDCPPDAICSNYWKPTADPIIQSTSSGVCLTNCDRQSCPSDRPICAVLPGLTPDHAYCFGCLQDSDCADAGPGAFCEVTPTPTFNCRLPAGQ